MKTLNSTFLLRFAIAVILLAHSIPGMFSNGINDFGNLFLNQIGFAPLGVPIAWSIKLSHLVAALCLIFEKWSGIQFYIDFCSADYNVSQGFS